MLAPKRFLPSLSMLSIFETAARTGSFSAAAIELCLSQSAVSRQIKCLEDQLGQKLFIRDKKTVRVTEAGEQYAQTVREALMLIVNASMNLRANPGSCTLNLAILPSIGGSWLVPKLPAFLDQNPDIKINLTTYMEPFEFHKENLDFAIHFGSDNWRNAEAKYLMPETLKPVCSPEFAEKHNIADPKAVLDVPLLHLAARPNAWERWFKQQDIKYGRLTGMLINQFDAARQAAKSGLGLVLIPDFMLEEGLADGSLVSPLDISIESEGAYYLTWPNNTANLDVLNTFYDWLKSECK